ncbi:MAG: DNA internalization-related competence protein ComEC/Rec2 [Gammaproteobacteria bacterium]|nr:DNA internalization-related competence protein ComEC/Rec2 [Gammaproteobacteria bacterium]MBU2071845.1 DNA internalization-related competence protein ComEC/Rec2 [Gammaproteobacteria bacterium]MBU2183176.1 DNA internalization-related competence protein ComEC/Rec2 [Gammaproteobacteria bacterium]MBU2205479.1 DNA internalization-related competence protein ComEC/Rec2 [Gammaproteobacteria bacterium]
MKSFCIGVLAGSLLSLFLPIVPPFFAVFLLLLVFFVVPASGRWFYLGMLAYLFSLSWQYQRYTAVQQQLLSSNSLLTGVVSGTPKHYAEYSQFQLRLDDGVAAGYLLALRLNHARQATTQHSHSAQNPPLILAGQRWQLSAQLRPVAGLANPGAFNREAQALLDGVIAQGSVIMQPAPELLQVNQSRRQLLIQRLEQQLAPFGTAAILRALTVGERNFSPQQWQGLQDSGLAHLLAISGLHIGLVFGWSLLLIRAIPWPLGWQNAGKLLQFGAAFSAALAYAWLAGFAIPTVRAVLALFLLALTLLLKRRLSYSHYWLLLCAVLLLVQPFYVLSKSFWLSVLAVAVIFLLLWRSPLQSRTWRQRLGLFFRFHLSLTLAMTLLGIIMFNGSATLALLSNLIFVPWTSLLALPLLLATLVLSLLGVPGVGYLWRLTDLAFQPLHWWLSISAQSNSWLAVPDWPLLLSLLMLMVLLLWLLGRQRWLSPLLAMLLVSLLLTLLRPASWQLHLIDVGQGLSVLLQKGERGLLYDAGPRYGEHSATAAAVLPYLRQRGIRQLDYLILSHDDSDHTGDWPLLQAQYPQLQLISNISHLQQARPCQALPVNYLGATMTMLQPAGPFSSKNDASCVLLLQVEGWKILLPGDISRQVEKQLLTQYPQLTAHVLVLAHHGSNSSSDFVFLHQLAPQLALNSASLYNRHQHPSAAVQLRLQLMGIPMLNTAQSGAISLQITDHTLDFQTYRAGRLPFWLQKPVGNAETLLTTR